MTTNPYAGYAASMNTTPQTQAIPGREAEMVPNSAGGMTFSLDKWRRLDRFLILGTDGGTYYTTAAKLTEENAKCVLDCIAEDGLRTVAVIYNISKDGRAIRNDPALFALALCAAKGDLATKRAAYDVLPGVARIGTHLFHFAEYVSHMRGWGRGLKRAVATWYDGKPAGQVAYQAVKYGQRDGWSHRDLIALTHPHDIRNARVYDWILQGGKTEDRPGRWLDDADQARTLSTDVPAIIEGYQSIQTLTDAKKAPGLIRDYRLPWEAVPSLFLREPDVWDALLDVDMGPEAMIRNLGRMTSIGLLKPMSNAAKKVTAVLGDAEKLKAARLHPIRVLVGSKVYGQGHGDKGSLSWSPVPAIMDALNDAFYLAFGAVEPTNKRTMLALDISGSMGSASIADLPLTAREGSCAMALVTANVEPQHMFGVFTTTFMGADISPKRRLDDVVSATARLPMGSTDCAQPMVWALKNGYEVDNFIVYTDNEHYAGSIHPTQALEQYRQKTGIDARMAVVAMTATSFTVADPKDPRQMDFVGFDTSTPDAVSAFGR